MGPVFLLSLHQLSGKWRLGIIVLLAAVPILISVAVVSSHPAGMRTAAVAFRAQKPTIGHRTWVC